MHRLRVERDISRLSSHKPKRTLAFGPDSSYPDRYEQSMAQGSRASICQRAVGEDSLSSYGSIVSVNRRSELVLSLSKETRMRAGVGAGGLRPPATRLCPFLVCLESSQCSLEFVAFIQQRLMNVLGVVRDGIGLLSSPRYVGIVFQLAECE